MQNNQVKFKKDELQILIAAFAVAARMEAEHITAEGWYDAKGQGEVGFRGTYDTLPAKHRFYGNTLVHKELNGWMCDMNLSEFYTFCGFYGQDAPAGVKTPYQYVLELITSLKVGKRN